MKSFWLSTTCVAALLTGLPLARAADPAEPVPVFATRAVDEFNGKVELFGGGINSQTGNRNLRSHFGALGAFFMPLGNSFGLQVDYMASGYQTGFWEARAHICSGAIPRAVWRAFTDRSRTWTGLAG